MKTLFLIILLMISSHLFATDPKEHYDDSPSFHGMILFGKGDNFYISHLPMWMSPHDYQMVAKITLDDANKAKVNKLIQEGHSLFSVAPSSRFVLPKFAGGDIASFEADVYKGHFERDGEMIGEGTVSFESLVHFKKLNREEPSPAPNEQKYVLFGKGSDQYLVHVAHGYPEIDEILSITAFQDPEIVQLLEDKASIKLICNTNDKKKNMQGLDESAPQNCEVESEEDCEECTNDITDTTPAGSVSSKFPDLFNSIMIQKDIYTDTNDLGSGYSEEDHSMGH